MPVHNGAADLEACIRALESSDLPRNEWELILVDDASTDASLEIPDNHADKSIRIDPPSRGPAFARNRGIEAASSPIVAFIDSDVMVHADALRLMRDRFASDDIAAVFGSYDDRPTVGNLVSQYRNLLHRFVHQRSAGYVDSFWAGCGAVRTEVLKETGTFDEVRFRRPEMEDVELGYRLRDAGYRIFLDPEIQCTHRKRITLGGMIASDFSRRGIPWTRLLLDRRHLAAPRGLSVGVQERISALAAVMFAGLAIVVALTRSGSVAIIAVTWFGIFATLNRELFASFAKVRGRKFLLAAIPLHLVYSLTAIAALVWGTLTHPFIRLERGSYKPSR